MDVYGKGQVGTIDVTTTVLTRARISFGNGFYGCDDSGSAEVGYQWIWSSFNMQLRAVLQAGGSDATIEVTDSSGNKYDEQCYSNGTGASITYTLGWAF